MNKPETTLCVASPAGGEYETLPRSEIRRRIQEGRIRQSQFIWHPAENSWKQARSYPELLAPFTPPVTETPDAPPLVVRVATVDPQAVAVAKVAATPVATPKAVKVKAAPVVQSTARPSPMAKPAVKSAAAVSSVAQAPSQPSPAAKPSAKAGVAAVPAAPRPKDDAIAELWKSQHRSQILYVTVIMCVFPIFFLWNRFGANHAVTSAVAQSPFKKTSAKVSAHFGYYVDPRVLMLQIDRLPVDDMTGEQFIQFLTMLATAIPEEPLTGMIFNRVKLLKDSEVRFILPGGAWKQLAKERQLDATWRAMMLVNNLRAPSGEAVLTDRSDNPAILQDQKAEVFRQFYRTMLRGDPGPPPETRRPPPPVPETSADPGADNTTAE